MGPYIEFGVSKPKYFRYRNRMYWPGLVYNPKGIFACVDFIFASEVSIFLLSFSSTMDMRAMSVSKSNLFKSFMWVSINAKSFFCVASKISLRSFCLPKKIDKALDQAIFILSSFCEFIEGNLNTDYVSQHHPSIEINGIA